MEDSRGNPFRAKPLAESRGLGEYLGDVCQRDKNAQRARRMVLTAAVVDKMLRITALLLLSAVAQAQTASTTSSAQSSVVTGCHSHGDQVFCINGSGQEVQVSMTATPTGELPAQFTGCHSHGSEE